MDLHIAVAVSMLSVSRCRASAIFKELRQHNPSVQIADVLEAMRIPLEARRTLEDAALAAATKAIAAGPDARMEPLPWFDPRYSALLNCVADPPPVLWVRGNAAALSMPTVAIVGSRAATPYALDVGARLAGELSTRGVAVASGLARGVDSAAHRGALAAGGTTIAVLGSGLDRIYPPEHKSLAQNVSVEGLIVSELGPGAAPLAEHFPLRNRIISGISLAVVVVEASENSGSLITARSATEQGRDVMAVPGSVLSGRNRGSHGLLKDGAKVVETADDILEELGWPAARMSIEEPRKLLPESGLLGHMEPGEVYGLDELVEATGTSPSKLLPRLMELELRGEVRAAGGGRFMRSGASPKVGRGNASA
ncbi:MAG: DNA-processing protein DprA [Acidobacteriota bacterium]|nr:DNA-processing protein DprA [Acidobacteriota bacterium]